MTRDQDRRAKAIPEMPIDLTRKPRAAELVRAGRVEGTTTPVAFAPRSTARRRAPAPAAPDRGSHPPAWCRARAAPRAVGAECVRRGDAGRHAGQCRVDRGLERAVDERPLGQQKAVVCGSTLCDRDRRGRVGRSSADIATALALAPPACRHGCRVTAAGLGDRQPSRGGRQSAAAKTAVTRERRPAPRLAPLRCQRSWRLRHGGGLQPASSRRGRRGPSFAQDRSSAADWRSVDRALGHDRRVDADRGTAAASRPARGSRRLTCALWCACAGRVSAWA